MPAVDPARNLTTALVGIQQEIRRLWAAVHGASGASLLGVGKLDFTFPSALINGIGNAANTAPTITTTAGDIDMAAGLSFVTYANSGTPALYIVTSFVYVNIYSGGAVTDVVTIQMLGCDPVLQGFNSTWVYPGPFAPTETAIGAVTGSVTVNPTLAMWSNRSSGFLTGSGGGGAGSDMPSTLYVARYALPA